MTALLEKAFREAQALSPDTQDGIARIVLELTGGSKGIYTLTAEESLDLDAADDEMARGDFATDEEVQAVLNKHGL